MRFCLYPGHHTRIIGLVLTAALAGSTLLYAQQPTSQIPAGVDVKAASEADNTSAKAALDKALADDAVFPRELLSSQQLGATEKDIARWLESHKANQLPERAQ